MEIRSVFKILIMIISLTYFLYLLNQINHYDLNSPTISLLVTFHSHYLFNRGILWVC